MKCPQCGKNSNVTISGKVYCTSCGAVIQDAPAAAAVPAAAKPTAPAPEPPAAPVTPAPEGAAPVTPAATPAPKMMDIAAPGTASPVAIQTPPTPADRPVVTPITTARTMQDVMRPAAAYHNPAPTPAAATATSPAEPELKPITEHTTTPVPATPTPAPPAAPPAAAGRLATAQAVPKSDSIVKFHDPLPSGAEPQPLAPQPITVSAPSNSEPELPTPAAAVTVTPAPLPDTAPVPVTPPPAPAPIVAAPAPAPEPAPMPAPVPELPAQAATQHEALGKLVEEPMTSKEEAFKLAMAAASASAAKPSPMAVGAAALAVVVMGGYIWLQNYPRMQLSAAAGRAGFTASLPGYVPSSYKLDGPAKATSGLVSLHYTAAGLPGITINQQVTSWDSSSLADNYVAAQDPSFSSVEGQGLTIYLYGSGKAAWVNHGIWYSITGATRLSRQELLKLAYSL